MAAPFRKVFMIKYLDINDSGYSVRSKLYCNDIHKISKIVVFFHGFGGHKDNHAAEHFSTFVLSKYKTTAVLAFDWPAHGDDARNKLHLSDCLLYVDFVLKYIHERFQVNDIYAYGTSFGGYVILKYIADKGTNPFHRIALRCPAIRSYDIIYHIMTEDDREKLAKGKDVLIGFDRKVKVSQDYMDELLAADITKVDYMDYADDILILHGSKDEIVPPETVLEFADNNVIECQLVEGADHRFRNPVQMDQAINTIARFLMTGE